MSEMLRDLVGIGILALLCIIPILLLFIFRPPRGPDERELEADNWAQRNDLRTPSLEQAPEAPDNAISAAVASQIIGSE